MYAFATLSTYNAFAIVPAAALMAFLVVAGHNYVHRADNARMYYMNIAFASFEEWRVSHVLSHHMFPNSRRDMEMAVFEPALLYWPSAIGKTLLNRYGSWLYAGLLYSTLAMRDIVLRTALRIRARERVLRSGADLVPFTVPLVMYVLGASGADLWYVLRVWLAIVCGSSFVFVFVGLNAGHHHPEVFQDGDALRLDIEIILKS